jgi:hypothetical protein
VKSISVKESFYKKSRVLSNLQLSRARKYRRTRRTRRATAVAVEKAADFLNDVQRINNKSQVLFKTYLKFFLLAKVGAVSVIGLAKPTLSRLGVFTTYNRQEKSSKVTTSSAVSRYCRVANAFNQARA